MFKKLMYVGLMGILCMVLTVPAFASLTDTQVKGFNGIPNITGALNFNKFNNHGGTWILQSIQVTLTLNTNNGEYTLDNDATGPASGTFQFGAKGNISSTDVVLLNSSFANVTGEVSASHSGSFSLAANVGDTIGNIDSTGPDGMKYVGGPENDSKTGLINSMFVVGFIGSGTYNINYDVTQWSSYGSVSGIEAGISPVTSSGSVQVDYIYNVVPEPATMILLAIGSLISRKKKGLK